MTSRKLPSERQVVAAPMSFTGSAARIWHLADRQNAIVRLSLKTFALMMIGMVWAFVAMWYMCFGLLVAPYRLLRRGQRKDKRAALRHREELAAIKARNP